MWKVGEDRTAADGTIASICIVLALLLSLILAPAASGEEPMNVEVGKVRSATSLHGRGALLVPVRYPIQLVGQRLELRVSIGGLRGGTIHTWTVRALANGGALRIPETRRSFPFVHGIRLSRRMTRRVQRGVIVQVDANEALDINRDGIAELDSSDRARQILPRGHASRLCASVPQLRAAPGEPLSVNLPACGPRVLWRIARRPGRGKAELHAGRLVYRSAKRFRGTASIELRARAPGATSSAGGRALTVPVQIKVGREGATVRAIGDSVTAGFGYYDDGSLMSFTSLLSCKPGAKRTTTPARPTRPAAATKARRSNTPPTTASPAMSHGPRSGPTSTG